MPARLVGSLPLSQLLPGLQQAINQLANTTAQIQAMKDDKQSELNKINAQIGGIQGVLGQTIALAQEAQAILNAAQQILGQTSEVSDLLADALSAGAQLYSYDGALSSLGSDLTNLISDPQGGNINAGATVFAKLVLVSDQAAWDRINRIFQV